jgi:NAD+ kinase
MSSPIRRVLVISKRSSYDLFVRQQRLPRIIELLARSDATVARMERADKHHAETIEEVRKAADAVGWRATFRERDRVGDLNGFDLVITVGGDGTLLWVSHAVGDTPMLGVNSAPQDSVGFLCGTRRGEVLAHFEAIEGERVPRVRVARMKVEVDGEVVHNRVLNDVLFAHPIPAMTSKYILELGHAREEQKSSGIWVSTAAGSTAAIRSAGGKPMAFRSRMLQYLVREPYLSPGAEYGLSRGYVHPGEVLRVRSKMRDARIYADGSRNAVSVEFGQEVSFSLSEESLVLFGVSPHAITERRRAEGPSSPPSDPPKHAPDP